jgi:2-dehydro-3-deoxygalactonokinase
MMAQVPSQPTTGLIGLDWGTSALRAFRMDALGAVLEMRQRPWGIMQLPPAPSGAPNSPDAAFERALQDTCGDWLLAEPARPVLACGMVGSAQGWREAAYLDAPSALDGLARALTRVDRSAGPPVHIVPGLIQRGNLPNVMRGEETQVLGVLASHASQDSPELLIGLPGTHSKWVRARGRELLHFDTCMTGEVFAALRGHTILGKTMQPAAAPDDQAFARGLDVARSSHAHDGLLSHIFSTRTLGLTGELSATAQADYLSGVLIGHEVASLARHADLADGMPVILCGEPDLCRRYTAALTRYGFAPPTIAPQATARGLWQIAVAAGLVQGATHAKKAH